MSKVRENNMTMCENIILQPYFYNSYPTMKKQTAHGRFLGDYNLFSKFDWKDGGFYYVWVWEPGSCKVNIYIKITILK